MSRSRWIFPTVPNSMFEFGPWRFRVQDPSWWECSFIETLVQFFSWLSPYHHRFTSFSGLLLQPSCLRGWPSPPTPAKKLAASYKVLGPNLNGISLLPFLRSRELFPVLVFVWPHCLFGLPPRIAKELWDQWRLDVFRQCLPALDPWISYYIKSKLSVRIKSLWWCFFLSFYIWWRFLK